MGYFGSKGGAGVFHLIVAAMPRHDVYIETHLGGGAVMLAKPLSARSIGIDIDFDALMAFRLGAGAGHECLLHSGDCVAFLEGFDFASAGRVLIYADPPYVLSTRTSAQRYGFDYTDADHRRLIACLRALPADVMVSGYPSALYDELLGDWGSVAFQAMTRGGVRTEKLWTNFELGAAHWATFAGRDYIDRQRIKRKAAKWAEMFERCPSGERLALLAALLAVEAKPPAT